jgi:mRNA-degrading endonuclease RelE of RelBE toxin-antitoxin system
VDEVMRMTALLNPHECPTFPYKCHKTTEFGKTFRKLDKEAQRMVDKTIQDALFLQPYDSKRLVSPEFRGKRSVRKGDYRIIFAICEECRKLGDVRINRCENCDDHSLNDVILFVCGHRKHIYDA